MTVGHALARISDARKRLAFRLDAKGAQVRTGRNNIATAVGADPKTAAKWIAEIRAALAAAINGLSVRKAATSQRQLLARHAPEGLALTTWPASETLRTTHATRVAP